MLNILRSGANTLVQAAQEVALELQQSSVPPPKVETSENARASEKEGDLIGFGPDGRIVLCGFPDKASAGEVYREDRSLRPFSKPSMLKSSVMKKFGNENPPFLVWNLSGQKYAYDELDGKLIEYDFPSRPIMPFDVLVEVVSAVHSWVLASPNNIAVVHDISGRRAAVVVACVLEILEYHPTGKALQAVTTEMGKAGNALVASQVRYYEYYCTYLSKPENVNVDKKLKLARIIVNGIPDFSHDNRLSPVSDLATCRPFVRIVSSTGEELDCTKPPDQLIPRQESSFSIYPSGPVIVSKDVMLRFFHRKDDGSDLAMFGLAFHVGFSNDIIARFEYSDIDGTLKNPRFLKDMFVDIIFSNPDTLAKAEIQTFVSDKEVGMKGKVEDDGQRDGAQIKMQGVLSSTDSQPSTPKPMNLPSKKKSSSQQGLPSETKKVLSPSNSEKGDSVLKEIEDALGDEEFTMDDFEISELDDFKGE